MQTPSGSARLGVAARVWGKSMSGTADDHDYETHQQTWNMFVKLITYASIGVVGVLIWMALFLT
jgi:Bacterial aa3 type cytochrome c oxidase subunit IV